MNLIIEALGGREVTVVEDLEEYDLKRLVSRQALLDKILALIEADAELLTEYTAAAETGKQY
jgi:hypothetical protein